MKALIAKPKRNSGKHRSKPNNVRNRVVDVEGYEYEVLLGLNVLLENTVFAFEWAEEQFDGVQKSVKHLQNVGYNNFAFIYGDSPSLGNNLEYKSWEELEINNDIIPSRKNKWGMIYFKK